MKLPAHPMLDEKWCEMVASFSADELLAGGLISADQWDLAKRIIAQQAHIPLLSNCRPIEDPNSN